MRRRWIQRDGKLVEVTQETRSTPRGPMVFGDLPDYESPIDGSVISGRAQRREEMKRHGCRPWEGLAEERKEADRQKAYIADREERHLDATVRTLWHQLPPDLRRQF